MNKEIYKQGLPSFSLAMGGEKAPRPPAFGSAPEAGLDCLYAPGSGITGMPLTRNWVAETMTLSPGFNPDVTE